MRFSLEIALQNLAPVETIEVGVREWTASLERRYDRIVTCCVVVRHEKGPHARTVAPLN